MEFWSKIYGISNSISNLWRQPTKRTNLEQNKYLPYFDANDNFPLKWHQAISESPSGTSCVSTIQDFLEGSGFSDQSLEKKIINAKGETMFQLHQKVCDDFGEYEGFVILVRYNALGKITELEHVAFENVRLGKPDSNGYIQHLYYNPYFGTHDFTTIDKDTLCFDSFNPAVAREQMSIQGARFKGQLLFTGTTTSLSRFYPMPEAHAAIKWMKIETGVSDYHEDNINNGFLQPFMLAMIGNPNEPIGPEIDGEKPITKGQAFDDLVSQNFMGAKRVGNMWVHWFGLQTELPVPIPFPSNNNGDLFLSVDSQATKKITIAFKVPAVLANIHEGVSLGGDGNQIRVAVKLMQQRVLKNQRKLTDTYQTLLTNFDTAYSQEITIKPYNPYPELEVLDDKVWSTMTTEEKRNWIRDKTDVELNDDEPAPTAPGTQPPPAQQNGAAAKIANVLPIPFPENVRKQVKTTLEYKDKMGIKCGGKAGHELAVRIMNNENLGYKELKRIYNYLKRNEKHANSPFNEGCDVIEYNAWGGKAMLSFLETKLEEVNLWLN